MIYNYSPFAYRGNDGTNCPNQWGAHSSIEIATFKVSLLSFAVRPTSVTETHTGRKAYLRQAGFEVRNEWAYADQWFERNRSPVEGPRATTLLRVLRDDAIVRHPGKAELPATRSPLMEIGN